MPTAGERAGAALLIGIGEYLRADQVWPLRFAACDAEAMAGVLVDPDVCGFPQKKVKLLSNDGACRDAVAHHLSKWLPEQARGAEIAVVYFAGHGMVCRLGQREEGYLLPYDADPDDLLTRGLLMADLARWIEAIEARAVVVCLDCCHAAKVIPRAGALPHGAARDMSIRPSVLEALAGKGRYLIASCEDGQVAVEADTWGHGLFTYHLLEGLWGAADRDGDGKVGISELFEYVAEAVERDALGVGMAQRPWSSSTGSGGVFLSLCNSARPTLHDASPATEERAQAPDQERSAREPDTGAGSLGPLLARLESYGRKRDAAGIPEIFGSLVHASAAVREQAKRACRALGWEKASAAILDLASRGVTNQLRHVLEGLAAFESHRDVVVLLDRLVNLLKGDLRSQAILILERKRLVLEMEKTASVFRSIQSPYRISRVLGQGLFTSAYAARDEEDGLDVVVRVLRPEFASQPLIRAEFLDLSRRVRPFVHQNLVLTRDVRAFPEHDLYFVVRDYVDGVTLQSSMNSGQAFPRSKTCSILIQVLAALSRFHHAGIVHGGVKPSNIFVAKEERVVLGDPSLPVGGLGASMQRLSYDYRYAAPEMFQGSGSVGPSADLYALGCVTHELACGKPPFVADNPFELARLHVQQPLDLARLETIRLESVIVNLLLKLLSKSPSERFATIDEVLRALRAADGPRAGGIPEVTAPDVAVSGASAVAMLEEAVSIVSFDPLTNLLSFGPVRPENLPASQQVPRRLGNYEIERTLGKGGMGTVYLARDMNLDRQVALKVLNLNVHQVSRRFLYEARALARLDHPGIVRIFEMSQAEDVLYFTLEYVSGGSLSQMLRRQGPLAPRAAAGLVRDMAQAVHSAHEQGIIHRDLKPSNILLTEKGTPKISDFGLVKLRDQIRQEEVADTASGMTLGTPGYMAPEQIQGQAHQVGPAADIYGLGAILHECLTGRRPFQEKDHWSELYQTVTIPAVSLRQLRPEIPASLERICLKCLEKEPQDRYASADQLARALDEFLAGREPEEPAAQQAERKDVEPTTAPPALPTGYAAGRPENKSGLWERVRSWLSAPPRKVSKRRSR